MSDNYSLEMRKIPGSGGPILDPFFLIDADWDQATREAEELIMNPSRCQEYVVFLRAAQTIKMLRDGCFDDKEDEQDWGGIREVIVTLGIVRAAKLEKFKPQDLRMLLRDPDKLEILGKLVFRRGDSFFWRATNMHPPARPLEELVGASHAGWLGGNLDVRALRSEDEDLVDELDKAHTRLRKDDA